MDRTCDQVLRRWPEGSGRAPLTALTLGLAVMVGAGRTGRWRPGCCDGCVGEPAPPPTPTPRGEWIFILAASLITAVITFGLAGVGISEREP